MDKPMRQVLVQNPETSLFLCNRAGWSADAAAARDFHTTLNAIAFCLQHQLADANVVVRFNYGSMNDLVVPVASERPSAR